MKTPAPIFLIILLFGRLLFIGRGECIRYEHIARYLRRFGSPVALAIGAALLPACASVGPTPEQLTAMQGTSSSLCVQSPGWNGSQVSVSYASFGGKSVGTAGGGGEVTCGSAVVKFNNEGKLPPGTVSTTTTTVPK